MYAHDVKKRIQVSSCKEHAHQFKKKYHAEKERDRTRTLMGLGTYMMEKVHGGLTMHSGCYTSASAAPLKSEQEKLSSVD